MIVECRIDDLLALIGKKLSREQLEDTLFLIKAEVEKIEGNITTLLDWRSALAFGAVLGGTLGFVSLLFRRR